MISYLDEDARDTARVVEGAGGIDVLVNNAAFQMSRESLDEISDEECDRIFSTNIGAMFRITKAAVPHIPATMPPEQVKTFGSEVPMKRPGQPVELAAVHVTLASDEASHVSGATIAVTGGKPIL